MKRAAGALAVVLLARCGPIGIGLGAKELLDDGAQDTVIPEVRIQRLFNDPAEAATDPYTKAPAVSFVFVKNKTNLVVRAEVQRIGPGDPVTIMEERTVGSPFDFPPPDIQLPADADGTYRLTATVRDGLGVATDARTWTVDSKKPAAPASPRVLARSLSSITFGWNEAEDTRDGSGVIKYLVRYGLENAPDPLAGTKAVIDGIRRPSPADVGNVASVVLTGVDSCRLHQLRVASVDRAGNESADSAKVTVRTECGGDLAFGDAVEFDVGDRPVAIAVADFNDDGLPDLAVANAGSDTVSILTGIGPTTPGGVDFLLARTLPVSDEPRTILVGDFNSDGVHDLAVGGISGIGVLLAVRGSDGRGTGEFEEFQTAAAHATWIAAGDVDRDGILDLAHVGLGSFAEVYVLKGQGTDGRGSGAFSNDSSLTFRGGLPADQRVFVNLADFNDDKILDAAMSLAQITEVRIVTGGPSAEIAVLDVGGAPGALAVADFDRDGVLDLAVVNRLQASGALRVFRGLGENGRGSLEFELVQTLSIGSFGESAAVADFDTDGVLDVAVANRGSHDVTVYRGGALEGTGPGRFGFVASFPSGEGETAPAFVTAADLNLDDIPDLIMANSGTDRVSVRLGGGVTGAPSGSFRRGTNIVTPDFPFDLVAADLTSDRIVDLAVLTNPVMGEILPPDPDLGAGGATLRPIVSVYAGLGQNGRPDGTYGPPISTGLPNSQSAVEGLGGAPFAITSRANALAVGDFDDDDRPDLAVVGGAVAAPNNLAGIEYLHVLLGDGSGTFAVRSRRADIIAFGAVCADLNSDRIRDVLTFGDDTRELAGLAVLRGRGVDGRGDGGFDIPQPFALSLEGFASAVVEDLDGDKAPDIAAVRTTGVPGVVVFLANKSATDGDGALGDGTFVELALTDAGADPRAIASGDFNRDKVPDLAVANASANGVSVLLGRGDGTFDAAASVPGGVGLQPVRILTADLDRDGELDLVTVNAQDGSVTVLYGAGDGTFGSRLDVDTFDASAPGAPARTDVRPVRAVVGEFNGDSVPDLAVINQGIKTIQLLLGVNANE